MPRYEPNLRQSVDRFGRKGKPGRTRSPEAYALLGQKQPSGGGEPGPLLQTVPTVTFQAQESSRVQREVRQCWRGFVNVDRISGLEPRWADQRYVSHWACAGKGACDGIRYIQTPL